MEIMLIEAKGNPQPLILSNSPLMDTSTSQTTVLNTESLKWSLPLCGHIF